MSAAASQERVLEYCYLSFGGKDGDSGKEYPPKWGMQYSLNVFKDEGHGPMAVIALESQGASIDLMEAQERKGSYAALLGIRKNITVAQVFGSFREAQRLGILAGRSRKGAFLNAVTSNKQQVNYTGPEQQKKGLSMSSILGGGGPPQQAPATSLI